MRAEPLTLAFLWEATAPNGRLRELRGRMGSTRIIIKPLPGATSGRPKWSLQLAETEDTITPEQLSWQIKRGEVQP
jgi:hypothetical protein